MNRNQITTLGQLKENDRFHRIDDKKKTVYQVMEQPQPLIKDFIVCLPGVIANNPFVKETNYGRHLISIHKNTNVVFLRNINEI